MLKCLIDNIPCIEDRIYNKMRRSNDGSHSRWTNTPRISNSPLKARVNLTPCNIASFLWSCDDSACSPPSHIYGIVSDNLRTNNINNIK